jgi:hypothetical protein
VTVEAARSVAWHALEHAVASAVPTPRRLAVLGEFMAMGRYWSPPDDRPLWAYKHVDTRRYVFLDDAGSGYVYDAVYDAATTSCAGRMAASPAARGAV